MRKYGRRTKHASNMIKNLAESIIIYEKVTTTKTKAKDACALVDKAITIAKENNLTSRKRLLSLFMHNTNVVKKIIEDLGPRFEKTNSGFTKVYKFAPRVGDNAPRVVVILSKSKFLNNLSDTKSTDQSKQETTKDTNKTHKKV